MAKKVVASLQTGEGKSFTKCIKMIKSQKALSIPVQARQGQLLASSKMFANNGLAVLPLT